MLPPDPTLDELRAALAPVIARNAGFDGWSALARDRAAEELGVAGDLARLALDTPVVMIDAWFASIDAAMAAALPMETLALRKVRERITALVETRLDLLAPDREALRRALAVLAQPQNLATAARLGWRAADVMWRQAGDRAADYNHYTKRATLGAIYAATVTVFLDDESEGQAQTRTFLSRRIDGLMRFEGAKARLIARHANAPSLSRFVGRLRYRLR